MKNLIFVLASISALTSFADDLPRSGETAVYYTSSATAERSRRKEHPWKINCIGHDTEWISNANLQASFESHDKSVHQKELVVDGVHDDIRRHVYETLNYNFEYSGDDVLHMSFSSAGNRTQQNEWSTDCTYTKTQSSITSASQKLSGKAYLVVPRNVYLLRIVNTKSSLKNLTSNSTADLLYYPAFAEKLNAQKSIRQIQIKGQTLPFGVGQVLYQMVRPGDVLEMDLAIESTELTDQSADLEWDINFMGNKHCGDVLAAPGREFSASQVLSLIRQPITTDDSFDQFVMRTSCLRDSSYIHELMVNSSGKSFANLIEGYQQWMDAQSFATNSANRSQYAALANSMAQLTLFDLSENLLQDMTAYCKVDELPVLIGLPPAFKALIRGYHSAARTYLKIDYLWQIGRNPHIDLFLQKMREHEAAGLTYAQADNNPDFLNYARAAQYKLFTDDIRVYGSMKTVLSTIPHTVTESRTRAELDDLVAQADLLSKDISGALLDAINGYGRRKTIPVVAAALSTKWTALMKLRDQIADAIRDDLDWFKYDESDITKTRFTEDLSTINRDIYRGNADLLVDNSPSPGAQLRREILLKSGDTDVNGRVDVSKVQALSSQINQCLASPTNGAN